MTENEICPCCEVGTTRTHTFSDEYVHRGRRIIVEGLTGYRCESCEELSFDAALLKANNKLVAQARAQAADMERREMGMLLADEIRALRELLQITQQEASSVFGGGENAFSKYERGEIVQSASMDLLMRVARAIPDAATWLLTKQGISVGDRSRVSARESGWVTRTQGGMFVFQASSVALRVPSNRNSRDWATAVGA